MINALYKLYNESDRILYSHSDLVRKVFTRTKSDFLIFDSVMITPLIALLSLRIKKASSDEGFGTNCQTPYVFPHLPFCFLCFPRIAWKAQHI